MMTPADRGRVELSRRVATAAAVAVVYFLGTQVGLRLTPNGQAVSVVWPPNALLLAALLLTPRRDWVWCLLAILPVHLTTQLLYGIHISTAIGWYVTNTSEALLAAYWLRRYRPTRLLFQTLSGVVLFLVVAVLGATGLTSFLDAAVVSMTTTGAVYWTVWQQRFMSNALATLTMVPAIVMIASAGLVPFRASRLRRYIEGGLLALSLLIVNLLFTRLTETPNYIPGLLYTVLPVLFWAAVRFGPTGMSIILLVATSSLIWTAVKVDPFSSHDVLSLQMLLAMLNVLSLSLAVVIRESRRLQSLHTSVLKSIRDAVAIVDPAGVIIDANDAWVAAAREAGAQRLDGVAVHANYLEHHRRTAHESRDAGKLVSGLEEVLNESRPHFEMEYMCRQAERPAWFSISVVPLWGGQRGAVITHTEITWRKRAEAEALEMRDELALAGRVMTMGTLSATLTHELSQPLAAILSNAQTARRLIENEPADLSQLDLILADVVGASRRAGSILHKVRAWLMNGKRDSQILNLNLVTMDVIDLLQADLIRRGVSVASDLAPRLPLIRGDRVQLQQLVLNLIVNACDAMSGNTPDRRRVTVTTARDNGWVRLSVKDLGTGISPDRLAAVFEPFVTTKRTGLGLGLTLCRSIVDAHRGQLSAENNQEHGATFHCTLPHLSGDRASLGSES